MDIKRVFGFNFHSPESTFGLMKRIPTATVQSVRHPLPSAPLRKMRAFFVSSDSSSPVLFGIKNPRLHPSLSVPLSSATLRLISAILVSNLVSVCTPQLGMRLVSKSREILKPNTLRECLKFCPAK